MTDILTSLFGSQRRRPAPTPQSPPAARQSFPMGPGAYIGGGGDGSSLSEADRESARQFGEAAASAARGSNPGPVIPGAVRTELPSIIGPGGITGVNPVAEASRAVGSPAEYLNRLIAHESNGDPNAAPATSSALGHAQFTDNTWLSMMHRYAGRYGPHGEEVAAAIRPERNGFKVDGDRRRILDLRRDPRWSALMAAHFAEENVSALRARLNRPIREGEVYLAHFLGDRDAANLLSAASRGTQGRGHGQQPATAFVARGAVDANPTIFYEGGNYETRVHARTGKPYRHYVGGGRARSVREVIELQTRRFRNVEYRSSVRDTAE